MATRARRNRRAHARHGIDEALTDTADAIADMAQRVQLNGPEPTYASEKLGHALYKSADGGVTWKKLTNGIPQMLDRIGVAVARSSPDVVYMISETPNYEGEIWRSDDAGA